MFRFICDCVPCTEHTVGNYLHLVLLVSMLNCVFVHAFMCVCPYLCDYLSPLQQLTGTLAIAVFTAVLGSLQYGYSLGVINAPQKARLNTGFTPLLGQLFATTYWYLHANWPVPIRQPSLYKTIRLRSLYTSFCSTRDEIRLWVTRDQLTSSPCLDKKPFPKLFSRFFFFRGHLRIV